MTQENKDKLNKYAEIKANIKELEVLAEELNPQVLEIMQGEEVEEIDLGDMGKLSMGSRRTWKYTAETQELKKKLDSEQKIEQQTGKADYTEKKYVLFKTLSENDE